MTVLIEDAEQVAMLSYLPDGKGKVWHFDDVYSIEARLHSGAFGTVYRVTDNRQSDKRLAVKIIRRAVLQPRQEHDIISEVNVMRDLSGVKNVVELVDYFVDDKNFYIVQGLAEGGDVYERIAAHDLYSEQAARSVAIALLRTIQKLHSRNIVHRDIKPENLLLSNERDKTSILLADFGFATYLPEEGYLLRRCGTPSFTAPEVWLKRPYGKACDMWSVGNVLYMLIDGRPPFCSEDNTTTFHLVCKGDVRFEGQRWDRISDEAKRCILGLLTVDPRQRLTAEQALQSTWIQSGLTDALFENLDWTITCSQHSDLGHSHVYSVVPFNRG